MNSAVELWIATKPTSWIDVVFRSILDGLLPSVETNRSFGDLLTFLPIRFARECETFGENTRDICNSLVFFKASARNISSFFTFSAIRGEGDLSLRADAKSLKVRVGLLEPLSVLLLATK